MKTPKNKQSIMWKTTLLSRYLKVVFMISLLGLANLIFKGVITVLRPSMTRSGVLKSRRFFILFSLFAVSCSLKNATIPSKESFILKAMGASVSGELRPYSLNNIFLISGDQVSVSFTDVTDNCRFISLSNSEVNFNCTSKIDSAEDTMIPKYHSGKKSYLWFQKGKKLTHLWVNRYLYSCNISETEGSISCESAIAVRTLASQTR
ncbi:MAG: hypothetical protein EXR74_09525 [Bdellovibrionales bacterium]|nr:hypothetical protein [Bdellovibrionales bacterium]